MTKELNEPLFVLLTSIIIILGLAFLNIFGVKMIHAPLLVAAAIIGYLAKDELSKVNPWVVAIIVIAGVIVGILMQPQPSMNMLITVATAFAVFLFLPLILLEIRKKTKK